MTDEYDFLVGTVVGFLGLAGEVKIRPSTNTPDILLGLKNVHVKLGAGMQPVEPADARGNKDVAPKKQTSEFLKIRSSRIDRNMLLLTFSGLPDRTAVEHLEGAKLYCKSCELLPLEQDEFWVRDLVGVDVYTTGGQPVGKIVSIIYGGNDILEIQRPDDPPGKTILVPFVEDLVPTIDLKSRRVEIVDIPGLLEAQ